jgi:hypothetical protein
VLVFLFGLVPRPLLALEPWPDSAPRKVVVSVLVEIDAAAERLVDARSTRRLVPLELADVTVPPRGVGVANTALFFRVLGRPNGALRVELWERGEFHGSRGLAGSRENPQLGARRVALAAAELGRRLARKREAVLARLVRERLASDARAEEARQRMQEGPRALRSELVAASVPSSLVSVGSRLTGELSLVRALRLDLGAELGLARVEPNLLAQLSAINIGPGYRMPLVRGVELDLGLYTSALLLQLPGAARLDGMIAQEASWSARLLAAARLELRVSRQVRAVLGGELGGLLRTVRYEPSLGSQQLLRGMWLGSSLGLVITPAL